MITINLRPGQKRKRAGAGDRLAWVKEFGSKVKDPLLLLAVASWVVVIGWLGWGFVSSNRELSALRPELEAASKEQKTFANLLAQRRRAETIRDSLLSQIRTIRSVDGDRFVWPHVLDEVSKALPAYTWLTDMAVLSQANVRADSADTTERAMQFQLHGRTVDIQAYTRFLRQLEASPWIQDVTPLEAKTLVEEERPVTGFTIRATFKQADSVYLRTVPLSQSVR